MQLESFDPRKKHHRLKSRLCLQYQQEEFWLALVPAVDAVEGRRDEE
jgi:hypothetical protein